MVRKKILRPSEGADCPHPRLLRSFVKRAGRITRAQERAYAELVPHYCISIQDCIPASAGAEGAGEEDLIGTEFAGAGKAGKAGKAGGTGPAETPLENPPKKLDFSLVFGRKAPLVVEIGFGMGHATWQIAQNNPDKDYIGMEVHRAGIGRLMWAAERAGLKNLKIMEGDANFLLKEYFSPASVSAFHVFFPDPWPKKKHHKRRLIQRPFTELLTSCLSPSGYIYMATDWEPYAHFALEELNQTGGLENIYTDFAPPQTWRPKTSFEAKGLAANRKIWELYFRRL